MVDADGREWLRAAQIVERWPHVTLVSLNAWVRRGRVRSHRVGRERWICVQDVARAMGGVRAGNR